jgi:carboxyl-terminal processing protease
MHEPQPPQLEQPSQAGQPGPPQPGQLPQPPQPAAPPARSTGIGLSGLALIAISAAVVFWAGLSLGSQTTGRTSGEREAVEAFSQTYRIITDQYIGTPAPEDLVEGAIRGMFDVLDDPNSGYMRSDEFDAALDDARGEFGGVGAVMATQDEAGEPCEPIGDDCGLRVVEVLEGTPAEAAGLLAGDVVTGVDDEPLEGGTINDSIRLIRGPRGSDVELTLERDGETLELVITRDIVANEDVHSAVLADGQVGYLAIDSFGVRAADRFEAALKQHLDAGLQRLIVDVRDDPGGFVDATVEISSQFLEDGAVFWQEDASGQQTAVDVVDGGLAVDPEIEVVVLMNAGSASASEILAAALQDAGRARLVGERSFGKGTVQEWTELPGENGGFRLSVAQWLTRNKSPIDGTGLLPDVTVADAGVRYRPGAIGADPARDAQVQAAIALLLDQPLSGQPAGQGLPASPAPATSPSPPTQ